ncbi:MAG: replicative DNA helicase [Planctomycetaceae bacterium]|jgi:replicative DNA helicase|nr:replicative DNA helicase [Planctomycetaceae bacterium]
MSTVRKTQKENNGIFNKLPPHSEEAERAVIGALLLDPEWCDEVVMLLRPDDFWRDAHRRIYQHLVDMRNENMPIDITLLINRIKKADELEAVGGHAYIGELMQNVHVTAHTAHYARIVRDKGLLRKMIHIGSEMVEDAFTVTMTSREVLGKAEQTIFELSELQTVNHVADMPDVVANLYEYINDKLNENDNTLKTGFHDVDDILDGLHQSELVVLAARPSMGKTAFVTNIAEHTAFDLQQTVLFVSLEMSKKELGLRILQSRGLISGERIKKKKLLKEDYNKLHRTLNEMEHAKLYIDETPNRTVTEIAAIARRFKRQQDLRLLIIDYIGLITPSNERDPRQEQVAKIARQLKGLARELRIPVICLAQLNRQADINGNNRPRLSHLRESGAIEQDADVVIFIHREEQYMTKEEAHEKGIEGKADIIVAKSRNGRCDDTRLNWFGDFTRFENVTHHTEKEPTLYDVLPDNF